jgi:hypothetical protein
MLQLSIFADARALQMHLELGTLCRGQFQGGASTHPQGNDPQCATVAAWPGGRH